MTRTERERGGLRRFATKVIEIHGKRRGGSGKNSPAQTSEGGGEKWGEVSAQIGVTREKKKCADEFKEVISEGGGKK